MSTDTASSGAPPSPVSWPEMDQVVTGLWPWLRSRRWFPGPGDSKSSVRVIAVWDLTSSDNDHRAVREQVGRAHNLVRTVVLSVNGALIHVPLVLAPSYAPAGNAEPVFQAPWGVLFDGATHPAWIAACLHDMREQGNLDSSITPDDIEAMATSALTLSGEQSNTSVLLSSRHGTYVLKVYRMLHAGTHPDLEIGQALASAHWPHIAPPAGSTQLYLPGHSQPALSALMCPFIHGARDGFDYFVELAATGADPTAEAEELGRVTAQLHATLTDAFGTFEPPNAHALLARITDSIDKARRDIPQLTVELRHALLQRLAPLNQVEDLPAAIRIHGDYHLGQTLRADRWYVLDFEGEPLRPLPQRRQPDVALRDVAGMLRSFGYAQAQAYQKSGHRLDNDVAERRGPETWTHTAQQAFLRGYLGGAPLDGSAQLLLDALVVEKATYELIYEHKMRPTWLNIPLNALKELAAGSNDLQLP